jgi:hypothetical protein
MSDSVVTARTITSTGRRGISPGTAEATATGLLEPLRRGKRLRDKIEAPLGDQAHASADAIFLRPSSKS